MVRMAEQAVSRDPAEQLVSLGLGSCIGCALVDRTARVAGLVHIVLPSSASAPAGSPPAKYADTAVPKLIDDLVALGARRARLEAVLCGGAHMFAAAAASPMLEIGRRNGEETRAALARAGVRVRAADVGGSTGRSVEVDVATGAVHVRAVGQAAVTL
jgi:chemotaxis protein CheD